MATVKEIYGYLDSIAPFQLQMDFDNSGLLVGREEAPVERVLVSLDITQAVVEEGAELGCQLIVAHHPVIFHGVNSVTDESTTGQILLSLIENRIAAICAHTSLDAVEGGVNSCLAQALSLSQVGQLHQDGLDPSGIPYGIGRVGLAHQPGIPVEEYAAYVKQRLGAACVRYVSAGKGVSKVGVGGGACGSMVEDAFRAGCDTFVTADVKYDQFIQAKALGLNLLDAGHYPTEQVVCPWLVKKLTQAFPKLVVLSSTRNKEVYASV